MKIVTIVSVSDLQRSEAFYGILGLIPVARHRHNTWVELALGDAVVALSVVRDLPPLPPRARVSLSFESDAPVETLATRFIQAGYTPEAPAYDEAYGRTLAVRDPDGLVVKITERDRELYT